MNQTELLTYKMTVYKVKKFIKDMKKYENLRNNDYLYHTLNELLILLEIAVINLESKKS
ncbi:MULTISPECIES: hypothetical protein [Staphylococcus]|uniref:hypothetical protein n=1 Tax=Staphylococcus TaxID=1279 RepID=UPI000DF98D5B|nr:MULTISPECIES: hypothetical protein [Staphylococcus]MBV5137839.1 hypothetical protein [Staphylococcus chromogenes]MBW6089694.1 hypothetical protein [Staphylococcus chromogenes]MCD9062419.1 hypothetical protein [Staphylococcus chromogenes]MCE5005720.1 hypothetical protein [Staphylococcus chromogenes]MCE5090717.1 hypothetical protein [Staphylococcus devriesei]